MIITIFNPLNCTLHKTLQFYPTVLHKCMNCYEKWVGEKIKMDEIKICVLFECEWNSWIVQL